MLLTQSLSLIDRLAGEVQAVVDLCRRDGGLLKALASLLALEALALRLGPLLCARGLHVVAASCEVVAALQQVDEAGLVELR